MGSKDGWQTTQTASQTAGAELNYFKHQRGHMTYADYQARGLPIGSGVQDAGDPETETPWHELARSQPVLSYTYLLPPAEGNTMMRSLLIIALVALALGYAPEPRAAEKVTTVTQAALSDPATHTTNGWCLFKKKFNGTRGRIYHAPAGGGCSGIPVSPIVVQLRGATFDFYQYSYLLKHLARNGFIAIAIDAFAAGEDHDLATGHALAFLTGLRTQWSKRFFIDMTNMAIIGHSRGGQTARHLALALQDPAEPWVVRAMVGLASKSNAPLFDSAMTPAMMMILQGTTDGDQIPEKAFTLFDTSGTEGHVFLNGLEHSMKLIEGAHHATFADHPITPSIVTTEAKVARGYVLAFLAEHLQGDSTWYDAYVRGDAVPFGFPLDEVTSQYRNGELRTVIDNAENGVVDPNTLGGGVFLSDAAAMPVNLAATASSPHQTRVLLVNPSSSAGRVTWRIPESSRNATLFKYLSLRIGQRSAATADDVFVRVRNGSTWSSAVRLADHGRIALRTTMCVNAPIGTSACSPSNEDDLDHMSTIRVPLEAFGAVNDVHRVRLSFGPDSVGRDFYIDSLEFSQWASSP